MDVMKFYLNSILRVSLGVLMLLSPTSAQDKQAQGDRVTDAEPLITAQEKIDIYPKLQSAEEVAIVANNAEDAGVTISSATVRAVKRDASRLSSDDVASTFVTDYVAQINLRFQNNTDKKVTGIRLLFINSETHNRFWVNPNNIEIEKAEGQRFQIDFIAMAGNPASLNVQIIDLRFDTTWKAVPLPSANALMPRPTITNPQVDTKPRPINSLRPRYTELARKNRVVGTVRLQVTVGTDGKVNKVQVVNALPDGLTEEAIHIAKVLQFHPALADGSPIGYSIILDVEFVLA